MVSRDGCMNRRKHQANCEGPNAQAIRTTGEKSTRTRTRPWRATTPAFAIERRRPAGCWQNGPTRWRSAGGWADGPTSTGARPDGVPAHSRLDFEDAWSTGWMEAAVSPCVLFWRQFLGSACGPGWTNRKTPKWRRKLPSPDAGQAVQDCKSSFRTASHRRIWRIEEKLIWFIPVFSLK